MSTSEENQRLAVLRQRVIDEIMDNRERIVRECADFSVTHNNSESIICSIYALAFLTSMTTHILQAIQQAIEIKEGGGESMAVEAHMLVATKTMRSGLDKLRDAFLAILGHTFALDTNTWKALEPIVYEIDRRINEHQKLRDEERRGGGLQ